MARLHEHRGKAVLESAGIGIPRGVIVARGSDGTIPGLPEDLPLPAMVKAQAWTTSRLAQGLIRHVETRDAARLAVEDLLQVEVAGFPIEEVLVEECLDIAAEYFFSYFVDDDRRQAAYLFAATGGSGIESLLADDPSLQQQAWVDPLSPVRPHHVRETLRAAGLTGSELVSVAKVVTRAIEAARAVEARSLEINPIVRTTDGRFLAADCRLTVDDYAVFRHPELGIDIARDLSNPPTQLDRIAYAVEANDYRGTFYFLQLAQGFSRDERYVGFHGAGGGGSMMSLDALQRHGLRAANYCDTSGNPPASKVYRAARIIASQAGIVGYFGSGSGVASQEQVHSARGIVKALRELAFDRPVVVRLGGNMEVEAIRILETYTHDIPARIQGFGKDTPVEECATVLDEMIDAADPNADAAADGAKERGETPVNTRTSAELHVPSWIGEIGTYEFESPTGRVYYNHRVCVDCPTQACVAACVPQILRVQDGVPVLAISREDARSGKCIECLACEVECREHGLGGGYVHLPIPGLDGDI